MTKTTVRTTKTTQVLAAAALHPSNPQPKKTTAAKALKTEIQQHMVYTVAEAAAPLAIASLLMAAQRVSGASMTNQNDN